MRKKRKNNYAQQGIAKSGAEGILMNICAKTNISNSIEILC